jgi:hypothetical protein
MATSTYSCKTKHKKETITSFEKQHTVADGIFGERNGFALLNSFHRVGAGLPKVTMPKQVPVGSGSTISKA